MIGKDFEKRRGKRNMIVKPSKRLTVTIVLLLIAVCAGGFYGVIVNLILRLLL
jgi:hypothetical protein